MLENDGIILRVCYNNQDWQDRCKDPVNDPKCWRCTKSPTTEINKKKPVKTAIDGYCIGDIPRWCHEQRLRSNYIWPLSKKGKRTLLQEGMDVFLFYYRDRFSYVYFARTKILQISGEVILFDKDNFIMLFNRYVISKSKLEALAGLSDPWRQGTYRVIQDINTFGNFIDSLENLKDVSYEQDV